MIIINVRSNPIFVSMNGRQNDDRQFCRRGGDCTWNQDNRGVLLVKVMGEGRMGRETNE